MKNSQNIIRIAGLAIALAITVPVSAAKEGVVAPIDNKAKAGIVGPNSSPAAGIIMNPGPAKPVPLILPAVQKIRGAAE